MSSTSRLGATIRRCALPLVASAMWVGVQTAVSAPFISHDTYIDTNLKACSNTHFCGISFGTVPAGKTLVLRHASCRLVHSSTTVFRMLILSGNSRSSHLEAGTPIAVGNTKQYGFTAELYVPYGPGQTPALTVTLTSASPTLEINCSIAGELRG